MLDTVVFKEVEYGLNVIIKSPDAFELSSKKLKVLILDAVLDGCKEFEKCAEVAVTTLA
jgi:hypothetical protein